MAFERHHSALIVTSLITVASFVAATAYTQKRLASLDTLSSTIETNSVPSIDYLSRASVHLTRISQLLDDAAIPARHEAALVSARQEVLALEREIGEYLHLAPLPGEREFWTALRADVDLAVRLSTAAIEAEARGRRTPAEVANDDKIEDALGRALRTVVAALKFDVTQSEAMARDVRRVHTTTLRMIVTLDAAATAIALFGLLVAYRASRRHDELLNRHNALLTARVTELDRFAGRVAHDVLSPLGTIATALPLVERASDPQARPYIERSQRALQRVQQLVEGLLAFAQSGAPPAESSRCDVERVLATVVADCAEMAAEKKITVALDTPSTLVVPCSVGVLTSIVQNLVGNAIKYMGSQPVRRIVVRAKKTDAGVRLEVDDTGPGVPAELRKVVFEPFVRGTHDDVNGTGLGLATVKRLAIAHGGRAGVDSKAAGGSVFWVELPLAEVAVARDTALAAPGRA